MNRKEFLLSLGFSGTAPLFASGSSDSPKVLLVVAHPDDEYFFAATVYRIAKELHGTVDQLVITNGEAGYRYSSLAEQFYKASLTDESAGRARLPEIRRRETLAAGKVLGDSTASFPESARCEVYPRSLGGIPALEYRRADTLDHRFAGKGAIRLCVWDSSDCRYARTSPGGDPDCARCRSATGRASSSRSGRRSGGEHSAGKALCGIAWA
jgi:hypothetical protein